LVAASKYKVHFEGSRIVLLLELMEET
jgi:hypothetical protein